MENDLISKKDLLNALKQTITDKNPLYHTMYALIDSAYTYEQPQGKWTNKHFEHADCSLCGRTNDYHGDFCKYCGAKMT